MRTGFLITARLKSQRLPQKLLLEVNGEPIIVWMIRRLKLAKELSGIVLCTSTNSQDDPLEKIAVNEGIKCYRGSEEDVISRLYNAALENQFDYVINMTADCPLLPFDLIGNMISAYSRSGADLISCHHLPAGLFLTGLKIEAMKNVINLKESDKTEYWLYFFLKTDLFKVIQLETDPGWNRTDYRIVLDYPEDWKVIEYIFKTYGLETYKISTEDLINWLDQNKFIFDWNSECKRKGEVRTKEDNTSILKFKSGDIIK